MDIISQPWSILPTGQYLPNLFLSGSQVEWFCVSLKLAAQLTHRNLHVGLRSLTTNKIRMKEFRLRKTFCGCSSKYHAITALHLDTSDGLVQTLAVVQAAAH